LVKISIAVFNGYLELGFREKKIQERGLDHFGHGWGVLGLTPTISQVCLNSMNFYPEADCYGSRITVRLFLGNSTMDGLIKCVFDIRFV